MAKVGDILERLTMLMPLEAAEDYDNVGLLAGSRSSEVSACLCALDLNTYVIDEAVARGAGLIVTHHPILFRGRKNLCEDDPEGALLARLIRSQISLIAMHTNYDNAVDGVNDALAARLGLRDVQALESGMRLGTIDGMGLSALAAHVQERLGGVVRRYGDADKPVKRVAVLGGAGGSYASIAIAAGADAFVTGEIHYHGALDAWDRDLGVLEAGHAATEHPAVHHMAEKLRKLGVAIDVFESGYQPFL
jgi:dinuclear metal center YbgI/SA1388 family protein